MAVQVVTGNTSFSFSFSEVATLGFNTAASLDALITAGVRFANTTGGALGCDTMHAARYSIAATTTAIDLFAGTLLSLSGAACVFARVRLMVLQVVTTTAGYTMQVYGSASNAPAWLPLVAVPQYATANGGTLMWYDPNAITSAGYLIDATHKAITLNSGANTVVANLLIVGNSSAA